MGGTLKTATATSALRTSMARTRTRPNTQTRLQTRGNATTHKTREDREWRMDGNGWERHETANGEQHPNERCADPSAPLSRPTTIRPSPTIPIHATTCHKRPTPRTSHIAYCISGHSDGELRVFPQPVRDDDENENDRWSRRFDTAQVPEHRGPQRCSTLRSTISTITITITSPVHPVQGSTSDAM